MKNNHDTTRWSRRLIAATGSCLVSAIIVAIQIPQIRDTLGIAQTAYGFIHSTVPSLGVAATWIGFALMLAGVTAIRHLYRVRANDAGRTAAVGTAVLVVAIGGLVAVESSFDRSTTQIPSTNDVALGTTKPHRHPRRRPRRPVYHSPKGGRRSSSSASPTPGAPSTPTTPPTTTSPTPATTATSPTTTTPAPSPPPTKPNEGSGGGSSSSGSGGNNNTVTVNKNNSQNAGSGNATGENARSGEAKNENNEGPVNISIG